MGEKFNGGQGCYLCDYCSVILWYGRDGAEHPENRRSPLYGPSISKVIAFRGRFYCSRSCAFYNLWRGR